MVRYYNTCPCVPAPLCPPPSGGNKGVGLVDTQCAPITDLPGGGGGGDNFNGGGSVIGSRGGSSASPPGPKIPPTIEFTIYDPDHNYSIIEDQSILDLANETTSNDITIDPTQLFKSSIPKTLADILYNNGTSYVPYDGVTLGSFLYNRSVIDDSLDESTLELLTEIQNSNISSFALSQYLRKSIYRASVDGVVSNYSQNLLQKISSEAKLVFPEGLPTSEDGREEGYTQLLRSRESLDPLRYGPAAQRNMRLSYVPPTDIDLCFSVTTRSGGDTGIRVSNSNTIEVIKQDLSTATITEKNEFYPIIKQDLSYATVGLPSRRNEAFYTPTNNKGIVDGLFADSASESIEYSYKITAEADWQSGKESVEVSGGGSAIPEGMLYTLIPSSISDTTTPNSQFRSTEVTYQLAWESGDSDATFNSAVSSYSGPRTSIYINPDNPFIDVMLTPNADGNSYLKITFTSLDVPLEGIYPRQIFSDFMIFAADNPLYDPFYGTESTLDQYIEGSPVKRSIRVINNPFLEVQRETYVAPVPTPDQEGVDNKPDIGAFVYNKSFSDGDKIKNLSKTSIDNFTSKKSILGTVLTTVSSVDTNYDLQNGYKGKQLPQADVFSLLTMPQIINFLREIPQDVVSRVWNGTYNNVKIIEVKLADTEKTYLTSSRLNSDGTSLEDSIIQKVIPQNLSYFNTANYEELFPWTN